MLKGLTTLTSKKEEVLFLPSIKKTLLNIVYEVLKVRYAQPYAGLVEDLAKETETNCFIIISDLTKTDFAMFDVSILYSFDHFSMTSPSCS